MFRKMLITIAATAAALSIVAPQALAAPSATLEGQQLAHATASDVQSRCYESGLGWTTTFQLSGTASGPYPGTFTATGSAYLSWLFGGGVGLAGFDSTFAIASPGGQLKGTIKRVTGRTYGTGACNAAASDATITATNLVYTVTLPDGTIDQGTVALSLADDLANSRFIATFHSTSRVADMDLDGVTRRPRQLPDRRQTPARRTPTTTASATSATPPTTGSTTPTSSSRARRPQRSRRRLIVKAEHARTAYFNSDVPGSCTDLAAYVDGVLARRGKTISPATADELIGQAQRIRRLIGCAALKK